MEKQPFYFTFGQIHKHSYNGVTLDKDCVVVIETKNLDEAKKTMIKYFGFAWANQYGYKEKPYMSYFPRGIFKVS